MMWLLWLCVSPTWAGCAGVIETEFPSEEACYRALREIKSDAAGSKPAFIAYCRPKPKGGAK